MNIYNSISTTPIQGVKLTAFDKNNTHPILSKFDYEGMMYYSSFECEETYPVDIYIAGEKIRLFDDMLIIISKE